MKSNSTKWLCGTAALTLTLLALASLPAYAESDDSDFSMHVDAIRILQVNTSSLSFSPSEAQMLAGYTATQQVTATVTTNDSWVLRIYGSSSTWSGPSGTSKPRSHIEFKKSTASTYNQLAASPGASVDSGNPTASNTTTIDFRVKLDVTQDRPGNYTYNYVTYELSAP